MNSFSPMKSIKCLAINSFSFQATVPPYNTSYLVGYLRRNKIDIQQIDANLITWNELLNKQYLSTVYFNHNLIDELDCPFCPILDEIDFEKLKIEVINNIDIASQIIRSKDMYDFDKFCWAQKIYFEAFTLIYHQSGTFFTTHLPYWGKGVGFNYNNVDDIYNIASNEECNPLISIFSSKILMQIEQINPDIIFIEIMFPFDIIGALTLNNLIKKTYPNIHINYSGISFDEFNFSRMRENMKKNKKLFFGFDSAFLYRNDSGIVDLITSISQGENRFNIENLSYLSSSEIIQNKINEYIPYDEDVVPDYSDIDLSLYFIPEIVFVDRLSSKCFWSKCSFCSINAHKGIKQLHNIEKTVDKIKSLQQTYGVNHFWFLDEACPIDHAVLFAKKLKQSNIEIIWSLRTRINKEFSKSVLSELYQSGLRELWIGLEHINHDILVKMNKATDIPTYIKNASELLNNAAEIGIGIHFCHIFGFPSETNEQREEVLNFYTRHKEALRKAPFFATFNTFGLAVDSPVYNNPEAYGITSVDIPDSSFTVTNVPYTTKWNDQTCSKDIINDLDLFSDRLIKHFANDTYLEYIWSVVADSPYELLFKANYPSNPFLEN